CPRGVKRRSLARARSRHLIRKGFAIFLTLVAPCPSNGPYRAGLTTAARRATESLWPGECRPGAAPVRSLPCSLAARLWAHGRTGPAAGSAECSGLPEVRLPAVLPCALPCVLLYVLPGVLPCVLVPPPASSVAEQSFHSSFVPPLAASRPAEQI